MKTIIRIIIKILLIVFALSMVFLAAANIVVYSSAKNSIVTADEAENYDADCILVLGAGVREDGTPSLMLRDRLLTAIELYENGGAPKLLMSGDHGRIDYNEVECMKNFAGEHGVPEDDIFLDHAGFCTYDSVVRAKEVFGAEKIIVVTQKYLAKAFDMDCVGVPADEVVYRGQTIRDIRESIARTKDFIFTVIKPNPKYLGEKISLTGSGKVTQE